MSLLGKVIELHLVVVESPYAGDVKRNLDYTRAAMADCFKRGESPFASHLTYTSILDDNDPEQRELGIAAGLAWGVYASKVVVYTDLGISPGMEKGIEFYKMEGLTIEHRSLPEWKRP